MRRIVLGVLAGAICGAASAVPLEIDTKDSLATAGDFVHTELTPAGQNIASNLYSLLSEPDSPNRRAACAALAAKASAFDPDKLANRETIALGWLLGKMAEDPSARKFAGLLEEAYWDYFARDDFNGLKTYLMAQYKLPGYEGMDPEKLMMNLNLYQNALMYQRALHSIDRRRTAFEERIGSPASEEDLIGMHELESTLVYLSTSLRGNANVLRRVDRSVRIRGNEDDEELLDDAIIENQQAIEMAMIYHDIIDGTRELFSQVMESRLNFVMQRLTSITLILSIPTVIGGLYGMNVNLEYMPLALGPHGFGIICLMCVIICAILAWWLWRRKML